MGPPIFHGGDSPGRIAVDEEIPASMSPLINGSLQQDDIGALLQWTVDLSQRRGTSTE
jgi:hypothetical protein